MVVLIVHSKVDRAVFNVFRKQALGKTIGYLPQKLDKQSVEQIETGNKGSKRTFR